MKFVDLFAGLGGFHLALAHLGHECVFASEIDQRLQDVYERNFGMRPVGDIRGISVSDIPSHDVLCAGFPCQPFSKAGVQSGLEDPRWGDLFSHIIRIVQFHRPRFVLLENVPNLERHNKGLTWEQLAAELRDEGYAILAKKLSPHRFGVPQIRERIFIVGSQSGLDGFKWPRETLAPTSIRSVLDERPPDARTLPPRVLTCISMWQEFLNCFPKDEELPWFPIWAMEFGATYPYESTTPFALGADRLESYRGAHGQPLSGLDEDALFATLPSYARTQHYSFPKWKVQFIRLNRALYEKHRTWLDDWRPTLLQFPASFQKLEWNAKGEARDLSKLVLQVRASGLRAKRDTTAPSLVAMTTTQVPIITWEKRYMTPRECARLQCMDDLTLPMVPTLAYAALGNAVNVQVVKLVSQALLSSECNGKEDDLNGAIQTPLLPSAIEPRMPNVENGRRPNLSPAVAALATTISKG